MRRTWAHTVLIGLRYILCQHPVLFLKCGQCLCQPLHVGVIGANVDTIRNRNRGSWATGSGSTRFGRRRLFSLCRSGAQPGGCRSTCRQRSATNIRPTPVRLLFELHEILPPLVIVWSELTKHHAGNSALRYIVSIHPSPPLGSTQLGANGTDQWQYTPNSSKWARQTSVLAPTLL
jgi:hypothetical protein